MVFKNKFRNAFIQMYGIILINYYFSGLPKLPNSDAFTYRRAIATENVYCFSSKWGILEEIHTELRQHCSDYRQRYHSSKWHDFFNLRNKLKLNAGKLQNNNNMHVKNPCYTKQNYTLAHHRMERKHAKIQTHANRGICTNESCVRMLCFTDLSERQM